MMLVAFEPDDGSGGATLDCLTACAIVSGVVDHGQIAFQMDQAGNRIDDAAPARSASHFASGFRRIAVILVAAGHPQLVGHAMNREQVLRTDIDAVAASRAFGQIDDRQTLRIHL